MKRGVTIFLAALMALTVTSAANADAFVWFDLAGASNAGGALTIGAPGSGADVEYTSGEGSPLVITKGCDGYDYTFNIVTWVHNVSSTNDVGSMALDLYTPDSNTAGSANAVLLPYGAAPWISFLGANGPAPGNIVDNLNAQTLFPPGMAPGTIDDVFTFDITVSDPGVCPATETYFGGVGAGTWADIIAPFTLVPTGVTYGADQVPLPGGDVAGVAATPSIIINNVPEPGTLALLGLGALALIRRRR